MPDHRGRHRMAKVLDSLFSSFKLKTPSGIVLDVFLSSSMDLSYYKDSFGSSHDKILEVIEQLTDGDIFIDIGANIGFFSILASLKVGENGRVICFEPSFREFSRLLKNIQLNNCKNLLPYNVALANRIGESQLFIEESHTGLNFLMDIANKDDSNKNPASVLVPVLTGDLLLQNLNRHAKKVIKIDVEGAEFEVISGMRSFLQQDNIATVVIEITPKFLARFGHTKQMIYTLMTDCGFKPTVESTEWQYDEFFVPMDTNQLN